MSWWDRVKAIFEREAADVKEGLSNVGQALDAELERKEREQSATPEERIDMILEEQRAEDARFEELESKVLGTQSEAEATEDVVEDIAEEPTHDLDI